MLALLERHAPHRTAHASLIAEIRGLYAGARRVPRPPVPGPLAEPLSGSEIRVLRYLPTNLTAPEIARELSVSPNTVRTHIKSLYAKLGTHGRAAAVERARALGLLAPSAGPGRHQLSPHRGLPARISPGCMRLPGGTQPGVRNGLTTLAPWLAWRQPADLDQLEAGRSGPGQHTVNRGLTGQHARQHGVAAVYPGPQGGKRRTDHLARPAADTGPVQLRAGLALLPGHRRPASEPTAGKDLAMAMSFTAGGWRGEAQRKAPAWRSHQSRNVAGAVPVMFSTSSVMFTDRRARKTSFRRSMSCACSGGVPC